MEKVKIKSAIDSGRNTKDGRRIYNVSLDNDDRCVATTEADIIGMIDKEVEVNIKPGGTFKDIETFWLNFIKEKSGGKSPQKDWTYEKRKSALEFAVEFSKGREVKSTEVIVVADYFLKYLKNE